MHMRQLRPMLAKTFAIKQGGLRLSVAAEASSGMRRILPLWSNEHQRGCTVSQHAEGYDHRAMHFSVSTQRPTGVRSRRVKQRAARQSRSSRLPGRSFHQYPPNQAWVFSVFGAALSHGNDVTFLCTSQSELKQYYVTITVFPHALIQYC